MGPCKDFEVRSSRLQWQERLLKTNQRNEKKKEKARKKSRGRHRKKREKSFDLITTVNCKRPTWAFSPRTKHNTYWYKFFPFLKEASRYLINVPLFKGPKEYKVKYNITLVCLSFAKEVFHKLFLKWIQNKLHCGKKKKKNGPRLCFAFV